MKLALALLAALALLTPSSTGEACSCAPPPPACEAMWGASVVFTGEVVGIQSAQGGVERATFKVSEPLRGTASSTATVNAGGTGGWVVAQGEKYSGQARAGERGERRSSRCPRARRLSEASDDLAYAHNLPKRTEAVVEGDVTLYDPGTYGKDRTFIDSVEITA